MDRGHSTPGSTASTCSATRATGRRRAPTSRSAASAAHGAPMFVDSMTEPSRERKGRPMADSAKEAWNEVGDKFGEWSRLLGERYRKRGEELGSTVEEDRKKLDDAFQTVTRQLDQAFTSFGETLRDAEAK